jgi:hypothetical protein
MFIISRLRHVVLVIILCSCGKALPTLDNIDLQSWKDDKKGCEGKRASMITSLQSQTDKFLALNEQEIISLIGKPDENELYTRNQKFFYYNIEASSSCGSSTVHKPKQLVIRFNAIGLAKEAIVE